MSSEPEQNQSPELKPAIRVLTWFTVCYLFSLVNYIGTSQGLWFWFYAFVRPAWCVPNWAITPVWTILYGLIGWAAWDIWNAPPDNERKVALISFGALLSVNAIWPWLYFSLHWVVASLVAVGLHFVLSIVTAVLFSRVKSRSGYMAIPFLAWSGYLMILYIVVWKLNK